MRKLMNDREYKKLKRDAELYRRDIERREEIKEIRRVERKKYPLFKIQTTKLIVAFIFLNCSVVEIYSMWVMYKLADLSALYTLITAVIGETISFAVYAAKSYKETNAAENILLERDRLFGNINNEENSFCEDNADEDVKG